MRLGCNWKMDCFVLRRGNKEAVGNEQMVIGKTSQNQNLFNGRAAEPQPKRTTESRRHEATRRNLYINRINKSLFEEDQKQKLATKDTEENRGHRERFGESRAQKFVAD